MDTTLFYGIVIVLAVSPLLLFRFHIIFVRKSCCKQMEQRQEYLASLTSGDEVLLLSLEFMEKSFLSKMTFSPQIAQSVWSSM